MGSNKQHLDFWQARKKVLTSLCLSKSSTDLDIFEGPSLEKGSRSESLCNGIQFGVVLCWLPYNIKTQMNMVLLFKAPILLKEEVKTYTGQCTHI